VVKHSKPIRGSLLRSFCTLSSTAIVNSRGISPKEEEEEEETL
jgi:hypothetical protein